MHADERARALAVDVEIADKELGKRLLDARRVAGVYGSGEAEFGSVGDCQRVVEAGGPDHGEHRPEDLFLGDAGRRIDVRDDRRFNKIPITGRGPPAGEQAAFRPAAFEVVEDPLEGPSVDHRPDVDRRILGIADPQRPGPPDHFF